MTRDIPSPLLDVHDLHIDIHAAGRVKHVVRSVSFSVQAGQTLCIVGESGCGKSLTALSLMDLLPAVAQRRVGRLALEGTDLATLDANSLRALRGARIAMIFQDPMTSLNPVFTVGTQLADVLLRHQRCSRSQALERAAYLLRRVGVTDPQRRLGQYPFELSGGLRQRVMIAMALMCGPKLLIADEPTTALDVTVQAELLDLLRGIQAEMGLGMVFISHDMGLVSRIADRVIVMYAGNIVESGSVREVIDRPQHPYTSMLLGCMPRPGVTPAHSELPTIGGVVPSLEEPIHGCAFQDRCPVVEAGCTTLQVTSIHSDETRRHCLCIKPGALTSSKAVS